MRFFAAQEELAMTQLRYVFSRAIMGLFLMSTLGACRSGIESGEDGGEVEAPPETGDGSDTGAISPDPVGEVNDKAGFYVQVVDGSKIKYYERRLTTAADFSKQCVITDTSDTANNDIECIVDAPEEDVYFHGITLQHNFPSDMCSYVSIRQFYYRYGYYNGDTMNDPITYTKDSNGKIRPGSPDTPVATTADPNALNDLDLCDAGYVDATGCVVVEGDVPNVQSGTPKCDWDYTASKGPNCCEGSYDLNIYEWEVNPGNSAQGKFVLRESTGTWTGKKANCFAGPAFDVADATFSESGFPERKIHYVDDTGLNGKIAMPSSISKDSGTHYLSNFYNSLFTTEASRDVPLAIQGDPDVAGGNSPSYEYICYDRGFEVKARIRMYIQEWNSLNGFLNSKTTAGTPDVEGNETGFGGRPINDFWDWDDWEDLFPGF